MGCGRPVIVASRVANMFGAWAFFAISLGLLALAVSPGLYLMWKERKRK